MCTFVYFYIFPQTCLCILNISLCTLPFFFYSSCHKKLTEIIIGIFAFCTMTGVIALDKCGKHWNVESQEMLFWCISSISSGSLLLSYSLVAIMSKLTKRSKGFSGLLTSSVEILFSYGQGKAKTCLSFLVYVLWKTEKHLVHILLAVFLDHIVLILKLYSCCKFFISEYQNTIIWI